MAEAMKQRGLSKMAPKVPDVKKPAVKMPTNEGESGNEEHITTITHHADGTHSMSSHGEESEHPDHLHMLAHLGHHVTGGDAHHVTHHDGMEAHSHMVHEGGEHEDGGDNPHESLDKMLGADSEHEAEPEDEQESAPAYGGMGA